MLEGVYEREDRGSLNAFWYIHADWDTNNAGIQLRVQIRPKEKQQAQLHQGMTWVFSNLVN